jgi:drug/metabolite transporter (DMT)-like permease
MISNGMTMCTGAPMNAPEEACATSAPAPAMATGVGFLAVLLWALLAPFTVLAAGVPALQLVAMSFFIATLIGLVFLASSKAARRSLRSFSLPAALLGVCGLLGYHFFYFLALRLAPPLEANLINYLWPLLIVLFSALLPGSAGLRWWHVAGVSLGLAGAVLVISGGASGLSASGAWAGYGAALAAAITWSAYSVLSRRFHAVPSVAVTFYCAATACAAALASLALEQPVWLLDARQWLAVVGLGLGPVGLAFYVWDFGCKHGDIRALGAASYFAPLISTALLVGFGLSEANPLLWLAAILITVGALLAARDLIFRRPAEAKA